MEEIQQSKEKRPESTTHGWVGRGVGWDGWMDDMPLVVRDAAPEKDCEPRLPAQTAREGRPKALTSGPAGLELPHQGSHFLAAESFGEETSTWTEPKLH